MLPGCETRAQILSWLHKESRAFLAPAYFSLSLYIYISLSLSLSPRVFLGRNFTAAFPNAMGALLLRVLLLLLLLLQGEKVAMAMTLMFPSRVACLVSLDMSPVDYNDPKHAELPRTREGVSTRDMLRFLVKMPMHTFADKQQVLSHLSAAPWMTPVCMYAAVTQPSSHPPAQLLLLLAIEGIATVSC
eukprot:GHVU01108976.1.p2 GENE.GHVU01108976.1~~GHVU01108976.1.p2  ORF type:complete len:188 (+),score=23.55 GHVU01108976.1:2593-3156(+)